MDNIISFEGVSKHFGGIVALNDVSFSIRRGEIHAVVGENGAGKSTLMNVLSGIVRPDFGVVRVKGEAVEIDSPHMAMSLGISTVYQELKLCNNMNVVQNLFLGREETRFGWLPRWDVMEKEAERLIAGLGANIDVRESMRNLSVAKMQIIEIAKALKIDSDILILDEPTSALTILETRKLVELIRDLKSRGMTIIFISHRLEEIFEIVDRITVMRNGKYIGTRETAHTNVKEIVTLIAGREVASGRNPEIGGCELEKGEVVLEVRNLSRGKLFRDVDFQLHKGEILGFYGLQGAGRTELMETIFGLAEPSSGEMYLRGKPYSPRNAKEAIRNSLGMVPEDRKNNGLFMNFNIWQNVAIVHDKKISWLGILNRSKIARLVGEYIGKFTIKCDGQDQMVKNLSGGNQQKVVLTKIMSTDPEIILLDEPTRGIDVGTKADIFKILNEERKGGGKTVIVVTSELREVIDQCTRVLVMRNGCIAGELCGDDINENGILDLAFNG